MDEYVGAHIKAVFFDHDDTLVDTIGTKWAQHKYIARRYYSKELTDEEIGLHWGKPLPQLVCALYGTNDTEGALTHTFAHHDEFPKQLFPETIPALRYLRAAGKMIGIVTATSRRSFEHDLTLHNIPRNFLAYSQTADDTSFHKPDPRVFEPALAWLKRRQIKPEEVLYVGDGLHDMRAALGAGFRFLGVETGLVTAEDFIEQRAKSIPHIGHIIGSA